MKRAEVLKKRYHQLHGDVHDMLVKAIGKSKVESKHLALPCIRLNNINHNYDELVYLHSKLTLMDSSGYQYDYYGEYTIEDSLEILNDLN